MPLLKKIPRVSVDEAYQFPSQAQFDKADLLIQFLHQPAITDKQFASYQKFVDDGGGVVSIHESCIIRPIDRAHKLAGCIGCSWKGNKDSRWSKFSRNEPLFLNTKHPVFTGLPKSIRFNDESYWDMIQRDKVEVIGAIGTAANTEAQSFAEVLNSKGASGTGILDLYFRQRTSLRDDHRAFHLHLSRSHVPLAAGAWHRLGLGRETGSLHADRL